MSTPKTKQQRLLEGIRALKRRASKPAVIGLRELDDIALGQKDTAAAIRDADTRSAACATDAYAQRAELVTTVASSVAKGEQSRAAIKASVDAVAEAVRGIVIPEAPEPDVAGPIGQQTSMLVTAIVEATKAVISFIGSVARGVFTVTKPAEDYLKPQYVVLYDPRTGGPLDISKVGAGGVKAIKLMLGAQGAPSITPDFGLAAYKASDLDVGGDPKYYGFLAADGAWYVMQDTGGTMFRFSRGDADYVTNWGNRASLAYDYFDVVF